MTDTLLRRALYGNALFSTLSGGAMILAAPVLSPWMGLSVPWILPAIGFGLLGFAAHVAWTASREVVPGTQVVGIVVGDLSWVIGTAPLLALGPLSPAGDVAAASVAAIVGLFAGLQAVGLVRRG